VLFRLLGEFKLLGDDFGLVEETELEALFVLFCLSCVARVPLTSRGDVTGDDEVLGLVAILLGLGATGGGMVALFMGGE